MAGASGWYCAKGTQSAGPMSLDQLIARLRQGDGLETLVYGPGVTQWTKARHVGVVARAISGGRGAPTPARSPAALDFAVRLWQSDTTRAAAGPTLPFSPGTCAGRAGSSAKERVRPAQVPGLNRGHRPRRWSVVCHHRESAITSFIREIHS